MRRFVVLGAFLFTGLAALAVPTPAAAVIRYVTADGTDSGTCGTLAAPCRSITQGIARAGTSDHIMVGPGHYGPVVLSKAVTLESSAGAAATVIADPAAGGTAVRITAVGAVFGTPDKGFTVRGGGDGVTVDASNAKVQANRILADGMGVSVAFNAAGVVIDGNVLSSASLIGVRVAGAGASLTDNVVAGYITGIWVGGPDADITGNHVVDNVVQGIDVEGSGAAITRNVIASNGALGVIVRLNAAGTVQTSNNFMNNGSTAGAGNCGLWSQSSAPVNAERNYWGRAQGPGPDPGDSSCVTGSGAVDTVPFLTKAVVITTQTGR